MPRKITENRKKHIIELYLKGKPAYEIAKHLSHDRGTILNILHEANIPIRWGAPKPKLSDEDCLKAKEIYDSGGTIQDVMNTFNVSRTVAYQALRKSKTQIRTKRYGPKSAGWKGGRRINPEGYAEVWIPDDHPFSSMCIKGTRYIREHRLIMAEKLGRILRTDETVHHLNGNRQDNRPENLQLRNGHHGSGQLLCCAECGSQNLKALEIY